MSVTKIPVGLPFAPSPDREAAIQRKEQRVKAKESELGEARKMRKATDDSLQVLMVQTICFAIYVY